MKIRVWYDAGDEFFYVETKSWFTWKREKEYKAGFLFDRIFPSLDSAKSYIEGRKESRRKTAARKKWRKEQSKVVYEDTI